MDTGDKVEKVITGTDRKKQEGAATSGGAYDLLTWMPERPGIVLRRKEPMPERTQPGLPLGVGEICTHMTTSDGTTLFAPWDGTHRTHRTAAYPWNGCAS